MRAPKNRVADAIQLITILSDQSCTDAHTAVPSLRGETGVAWAEVLREAGGLLESWYLNDSKATAGPSISDLQELGARLRHQRALSENDLMLSLIRLVRRYCEMDEHPLASRIVKARSLLERKSRSEVPQPTGSERRKASKARFGTQERCPCCGMKIWMSSGGATGIPRHRAKGAKLWCTASGMTIDSAKAEASRSEQVDECDVRGPDEPSLKDLHWYEHESESVPVTRRTEYHVRVAGRLLRAGKANQSQYGYLVEPMERFLAATKLVRPHLFERSTGARDAVAPGTLPDHLKGDPGKTLNKPRTAPSKRVWYREIPVGKTN